MSLLTRAAGRLARTLATGFSSAEHLRALPRELAGLATDGWHRLQGQVPGLGVRPQALQGLRARLAAGGPQAAIDHLKTLGLTPERGGAVLTHLSREIGADDAAAAGALAHAAYELDPRPFRAKWLAFRLFEGGAIDEPVRLLETPGLAFSASEERRRASVRALHRLRQGLPGWHEADAPPYEPAPDALLYVAAMTMPFHTSGYATRTHSLVQALRAAGVNVLVLARPGYPFDRADRKGQPDGTESVLDGVRYRYFRRPSRDAEIDAYFREAAKVVKAEARRHAAGAIHAASNAENALPALIAARELGLPFTFEMRGLWELTRASSHPGYELSERFALGMALERHCAVHADRVLAISAEVGRQAEAWGVDPARIQLLPNCVGAVAAEAAPGPSGAGALRLAYAGSLLPYEGLELLVDAIALLRAEGLDVQLDVAGGGRSAEALQGRVRQHRLGDAVRLLGSLPPEDAARLVASCDAVALPRLPVDVCKAVPPIKLVEAMAVARPVVVPDLAVFRDEVNDGVEGLHFAAGDAASLAGALRRLAQDPALRRRLGAAAQARVARTRTWAGAAAEVAAALRQGRQAPPPPAEPGLVQPETLGRDPAAAGALAALQALEDGQPGATLRERARDAVAGLAPRAAATMLIERGRQFGQAGRSEAEGTLAQLALELDSSEPTLRAYFWACQRARQFEQALDAARRLEALYGPHPTEEQQLTLGKLRRSPVQQLRVLDLLDTAPVAPPQPQPDRVAYVLHNSLPYSSGGYGTRSHGVASGLRAAGMEVVVLTRPGFPLDIKPELTAADVPPADEVDGIRYLRTLEPLRSGRTLAEYVTLAADAMEARLRELAPSCVVAASNHLTALPALIAARRLGVPFCYEVRGLWEITRMSRDTGFEESSAFTVQRLLESRVAVEAERVFTLTEPMREELVARGVPAGRIELLPNSCDPERFVPRPRDEALAARLGIEPAVPVIGYVGTFVDYEGLEDLAAACALLKQRGLVFRLLLVGNENASGTDRGPITQQIVDIAAAAGMQDWVLMPGRVPHDEVEAWYSLIDVAPFPRKPWPVCEMVSPMKPLEALATEKAVVVSDVRALAEMIRDGETGLWFRKGSVESLADTLQRLLADPALRRRLGAEGRRWVAAERTWAAVGRRMAATLRRLSAGAAVPLLPLPEPSAAMPPWWESVDPALRERSRYIAVLAHANAPDIAILRQAYLARFGPEPVARRIPEANLTRADLCARFADGEDSLLDIGSGLGEFVNLCRLRRPERPITSIDVRNWDLWFDAFGGIERHLSDILEIDAAWARDVVTCFEVIEHLEPEKLRPAVDRLRRLARKRLLVSVPFMEPLPLHRGHRTRFDAGNLLELFPDARFTILGKGGRADRVAAWILCEMPGTDLSPPPSGAGVGAPI